MMDIGTIFALPLLDSGLINWTLPSDGSRVAFLLIALGVIFLFEVAFPLFSYIRGYLVRHSLRNLLLPAILLGVPSYFAGAAACSSAV